jgi:hypothetical protein
MYSIRIKVHVLYYLRVNLREKNQYVRDSIGSLHFIRSLAGLSHEHTLSLNLPVRRRRTSFDGVWILQRYLFVHIVFEIRIRNVIIHQLNVGITWAATVYSEIPALLKQDERFSLYFALTSSILLIVYYVSITMCTCKLHIFFTNRIFWSCLLTSKIMVITFLQGLQNMAD